MYCQSSIYMTVKWVLGEMECTPEGLAKILVDGMPGKLSELFEKLEITAPQHSVVQFSDLIRRTAEKTRKRFIRTHNIDLPSRHIFTNRTPECCSQLTAGCKIAEPLAVRRIGNDCPARARLRR